MELRKGLLTLAIVGLGGLGSCKVDTTKDVYSDWEAPEYQIYKVNGEEKKIPWAEVPEGRRWAFQIDDQALLPGTRYKYRVPIVKVEILAHDKDGNPVDPIAGPVWDGREFQTALNPKYDSCAILGERH